MTLLLMFCCGYQVGFPPSYYAQYEDFQYLTDIEKKRIDDEIILLMCGWLA